jgi:hypothetical protein
MKIETLQQARQAAFTGAYRGLRSQQWRQCVDETGMARWYNDEPGVHCAVGWLIPAARQRAHRGPHEAWLAMRIMADSLQRWCEQAPESEQLSLQCFLEEMQNAHDNNSRQSNMRRAMHEIARRFGLTIPPSEHVIRARRCE